MIFSDKRGCPFCRKRIDAKATVCAYCTREVPPGKEVSVGKLIILSGLSVFIFVMCAMPPERTTGGTPPATASAEPAATAAIDQVPTPMPKPKFMPKPKEWRAGVSCVYNRSDDRLVGAFVSSRPIPNDTNRLVTVAVDPELDPSGGITPGTTWELTVPKNATVKRCKTN